MKQQQQKRQRQQQNHNSYSHLPHTRIDSIINPVLCHPIYPSSNICTHHSYSTFHFHFVQQHLFFHQTFSSPLLHTFSSSSASLFHYIISALPPVPHTAWINPSSLRLSSQSSEHHTHSSSSHYSHVYILSNSCIFESKENWYITKREYLSFCNIVGICRLILICKEDDEKREIKKSHVMMKRKESVIVWAQPCMVDPSTECTIK